MQVPLALVTSSIGMAILPKVAAHAARGNFARVRTIATLSIGTVIWMMSPIAALGALFAFDAVRLVVGGSIEVLSVAATADLLRLLLLGLVAHGIISVAIRLFYGLGDTLRPTIAEVCGCLVIFGFATLWFPAFGLSSIAMALPFGTWIQAIALVWLLAHRSQIVHAATILKMVIFAVVASLVSAGLAVLVTSPFMDSAREVGVLAGTAAAGVGTIVGLAAYVGLTVLARRQEALPVLRLVASALPPKARALLLRGEVSS
jgi:putative peptidoglycan lipid II flippase